MSPFSCVPFYCCYLLKMLITAQKINCINLHGVLVIRNGWRRLQFVMCKIDVSVQMSEAYRTYIIHRSSKLLTQVVILYVLLQFL